MAKGKSPKRSARRFRQARHPLRWSLSIYFWLILLVSCSMAGVAVGGFLGFISKQSPMPELENYDPPQLTRVYDGSGKRVIANFFDEKRELLAQAEMPRYLKDAFLAIEDERFRKHFGVDAEGLARAIRSNIQRGSMTQGASTITQQLARNVSERIGRERSLNRKFKEALAAFLIEQRYSKDQILEFYLNHIFLGHNSYGVQSAARTYFNKDARDLNLAECAALAAIPKSPSAVNPFTNPDRLVARRNLVLSNMERLGMIDEAAKKRAQESELKTERSRTPRLQTPYFIFHMKDWLAKNTEFDENLLIEGHGGYNIYTTQNYDYQLIVEEEVRRWLPEIEKEWQNRKFRKGMIDRFSLERRLFRKIHNGSVAPRKGQHRLAKIIEVHDDGVMVEIEGYKGFAPLRKEMESDPDTGEQKWTGEYIKPWLDPEMVLQKGEYIDVYIQAIDKNERKLELSLWDTSHVQAAAVLLDVKTGHILALSGGADFYDMQNSGMYNRATQLPGRQPGSAFKPLLYGIALENGRTLGSVIMDDRTVFGKKPMYVPRNYENEYFGPTTLLKALSMSNNVVTVKLFNDLGFKTTLNGYQKFDIVYERPSWNLESHLAVCLGSHNATPLSIAASYLAFARGGIAIEPVCVTHVNNLQGETVKTIRPRERYVMSPQNAFLMNYMMEEVVRNGTGQRNVGNYFASMDVPAMGGKTGTTTGCVDAWFVGYTPDLVLAVWVGFNQVRSMGPGMTGSRCAAPIWRSIMERVLETRDDWQMEFPVPNDIVYRDISSRTGHLIDPEGLHGDERVIADVPFVKGTEPRVVSDGAVQFPYWKYQHPDEDRNRIAGPNEVPDDMLDEWRRTMAARGEEVPQPAFTEEITGEEHFYEPVIGLDKPYEHGQDSEDGFDYSTDLQLPY
ncbi:MAG: penicillin-binding protein 1A [Candidatus Sumerlaeia bacterium]